MVASDPDQEDVLFSAGPSSQLPDLGCKRQNRRHACFLCSIGRDSLGLCWMECNELACLIDFDPPDRRVVRLMNICVDQG